jgi:P-type Cu+ transporter
VWLPRATGYEEAGLLRLAAGVERASEHPLASAIVAAAQARKIAIPAVQGFDSPSGKGAFGTIAGRKVLLGNAGKCRRDAVERRLNGIVRARALSRATMRNVRLNLFFAFAYNALGVPIAAGVLYPKFGILLSPMIAAAAMSLSSVSVIGNALRLRWVSLT